MTQLDIINDGLPTYTGTRDDLERYYTPPPVIDALIHRQVMSDRWRQQLVLEPCAGRQLSIAKVLRSWAPLIDYRVITADLDRGAPVDWHGDFRELDWGAVLEHAGAAHFDQVITNPPFSLAAELVRALAPYTRQITLLLRLSFAEPCDDRVDLLKPFKVRRNDTGAVETWHLWRRLTTPRQQFRQGGKAKTDSVTTEWFTWKPYGPLTRAAPHDCITRQEEERWAIQRSEGRIGERRG